MHRRRVACAPCALCAAGAVLALVASSAPAQRPTVRPSWYEATSGSEVEGYLRMLQLDSASARASVTMRALPPLELRRLVRSAAAHPWAARFGAADSVPARGIYWLRPGARTVYNSAFPIAGGEDGPAWAGRGVTVVAQAGAGYLAGPLHLRLEPIAFRAQNDAFRLYDDARAPEDRLRDPLEPRNIDNPQRFGTGAYQRVDFGNSEARLTGRGVTAGVSTARIAWGPATALPILLGGSGPGFAHLFFGTARPTSVGIGRVHASFVAGRLDESPVSPAVDSLRLRAMSAFVVTFAPRGLEDLEVGVSRFIHRSWGGVGSLPEDLLLPLRSFAFKERNLNVDDPDSPDFRVQNELSSAFVRWRFPASAVEVYGEYVRNDAALNARDLLVEPDHASGYMVGLRKSVGRGPERRTVVWGEFANARITHIDRVRPQSRLFQHNQLLQGHTQRGVPLGSAAILGGGGAVVGLDRYTPRGRVSLIAGRTGRLGPLREGATSSDSIDVQHALTLRTTLFRGPLDLVGGATAIYEMNRDYRSDAFGVRLETGARLAF